ncbi:hypothetical protein F5Y04DRAFT_250104 [Hypomontagnella monticulosa]|nr:hypothetical protein F5Y04DRAFT_250104 [Hypomontagnella monticulosa]
MTGHMTSTGRGGAGNIADASRSPKIQPADLETPTLKTSVVTTGRGGSGNMAPNKDPVETRARQDVGPIERRPSHGATHVGRGGAANIARPGSSEEAVDLTRATSHDEQQQHQTSGKTGPNGLAAKAKEFFKKA